MIIKALFWKVHKKKIYMRTLATHQSVNSLVSNDLLIILNKYFNQGLIRNTNNT